MRPRTNQGKFRKGVFDANIKEDERGLYLICAGWPRGSCGARINPATETWEADHTIRRVLSNNDCPDTNGQVLCKVCHRHKTNQDIKDNAKGKRSHDKHFGIARKRGWR